MKGKMVVKKKKRMIEMKGKERLKFDTFKVTLLLRHVSHYLTFHEVSLIFFLTTYSMLRVCWGGGGSGEGARVYFFLVINLLH